MIHAEKKQMQRKLDTQMRIMQNSESSLHILQTQYNALEKQIADMTVTNYEMKERIISLETAAKSSIKRDAADNL
jgi:septal ring factor EnvC (AmiA/AmiB activator)